MSKLPPRNFTPPEDMMICYIRVSTQGQADQGSSLEAQEQILRDYAKAHGKTAIICPDICSGTTKPEDRPGLSSALRMLAEGKATSIACTRIDRMSRSLKHFITMLEDFEQNDPKIIFHSIQLGIDTSTPIGIFMLRLFGMLSELERDVLIERTRSTLACMKDAGRVVGTVPYGKQVLLKNGQKFLEDCPAELAILARVRELRAVLVPNLKKKTMPTTLQAICDTLMAEGRANRTGEVRWYPSSIKFMLPANPRKVKKPQLGKK